MFVRGKVDRKRETPSLLINDLIPIADATARLTTTVAIKLDTMRHSPELAEKVETILRKHKGNCEVYLQVATAPQQRVIMRLDRERFVKPSRDLIVDLELQLGGDSVMMCGAGTKRSKAKAQQVLFEGADAADPATPQQENVQAVIDAVMEDMEMMEE